MLFYTAAGRTPFSQSVRNGGMKKSAAETIRKPGGSLTLRRAVEIEVPVGTSLLEAENTMQAPLMEAGTHLMEDGSIPVPNPLSKTASPFHPSPPAMLRGQCRPAEKTQNA